MVTTTSREARGPAAGARDLAAGVRWSSRPYMSARACGQLRDALVMAAPPGREKALLPCSTRFFAAADISDSRVAGAKLCSRAAVNVTCSITSPASARGRDTGPCRRAGSRLRRYCNGDILRRVVRRRLWFGAARLSGSASSGAPAFGEPPARTPGPRRVIALAQVGATKRPIVGDTMRTPSPIRLFGDDPTPASGPFAPGRRRRCRRCRSRPARLLLRAT